MILSYERYRDVDVLLITNDSQVFETEGKEKPARDAFRGRFTEVRNFADILSTRFDVDLMIVSSRYGLIDGTTLIRPYRIVTETREEIIALDARTGFVNKLMKGLEEHDFSILLLPKAFIRYLIERGCFDIAGKIATVTSIEFIGILEDKENCIFLERRGARLGKANASKIIKLLNHMENLERTRDP